MKLGGKLNLVQIIHVKTVKIIHPFLSLNHLNPVIYHTVYALFVVGFKLNR